MFTRVQLKAPLYIFLNTGLYAFELPNVNCPYMYVLLAACILATILCFSIYEWQTVYNLSSVLPAMYLF